MKKIVKYYTARWLEFYFVLIHNGSLCTTELFGSIQFRPKIWFGSMEFSTEQKPNRKSFVRKSFVQNRQYRQNGRNRHNSRNRQYNHDRQHCRDRQNGRYRQIGSTKIKHDSLFTIGGLAHKRLAQKQPKFRNVWRTNDSLRNVWRTNI